MSQNMSEVETKPPANDLYEIDFYAWTQEQARLLRERRWADLDLDHLVDEVSSVGSSEKREIRNRLTRLHAHLLKWKYQPGLRGSSWFSTIRDQRRELADILETSPSLRAYFRQQVGARYLSGRLDAAKETGIAFGLFPEECPFTPDQVLDLDFFPEDRSIE
jgi:Domain of unknown function DUF29